MSLSLIAFQRDAEVHNNKIIPRGGLRCGERARTVQQPGIILNSLNAASKSISKRDDGRVGKRAKIAQLGLSSKDRELSCAKHLVNEFISAHSTYTGGDGGVARLVHFVKLQRLRLAHVRYKSVTKGWINIIRNVSERIATSNGIVS